MEQKSAVGRVVAACASAKRGVPKYPQASVEVGPMGITGDFHAGPINRHKKRGKREPNNRQLTIVAQEAIEEVNTRLGIDLQPGDLAENFLVAGLGDLSELSVGDRLRLGPVLVEVTAHNKPCATIGVHHPDLVKSLIGRRGVTAVVIEPGEVKPGDPVRLDESARSQIAVTSGA